MFKNANHCPEKTVYVGNLHESVTERILYELFIQAGPVTSVTIPKPKDGHTKFYAFVQFNHEISVPYACKLMHGIELYKYSLIVRAQNIDKSSNFNSSSNNNQLNQNYFHDNRNSNFNNLNNNRNNYYNKYQNNENNRSNQINKNDMRFNYQEHLRKSYPNDDIKNNNVYYKRKSYNQYNNLKIDIRKEEQNRKRKFE